MASSIEKLYSLDGNITVYPGHGTKTTIAKERDTNPYLYF
jgi:glyoxylase-like metal-dependent hydrolase (beta-lactamase superfamily II)